MGKLLSIGLKPYDGFALDRVKMGDDDVQTASKDSSVALPCGITSGMLYRDVVHIAWPSMVELGLTQLTSMVDLMMVGQLGPWALSAVGLTTQPKFLLMTMFMSMNIGSTAMIARSKGAGDPEKANLFLRQALLLTLVLSAVMSVLGYVFAGPMIRFMGAADLEGFAGAVSYLRIQMAGFVFMALTSTATAALRGVGDSRTAMTYNVIANVVNVGLNYVLIYGHFGFPRMEVAGASLATVLGQGVAFVLGMFVLLKGKGYLHLRLRDGFRPDLPAMSSIFKIGIPAMLEQLVMRVGMILYAKIVASLGTIAYATHQVVMNIQALSFMIGQAFAVSATSLMGQSLGKKRPDMAQLYTSRTRRVGMYVSLLISLIFAFFGRGIVSLYSKEAEIIATGGLLLILMALILPFQSSQFILAGALRGAGDTKATAVISFITVLLVRPGFTMIAIYLFDLGLMGAWYAMVADQLLRSALVFLRYQSGKWKRIVI